MNTCNLESEKNSDILDVHLVDRVLGVRVRVDWQAENGEPLMTLDGEV